jgi:ribosomal protein L37AE/L43A
MSFSNSYKKAPPFERRGNVFPWRRKTLEEINSQTVQNPQCPTCSIPIVER